MVFPIFLRRILGMHIVTKKNYFKILEKVLDFATNKNISIRLSYY